MIHMELVSAYHFLSSVYVNSHVAHVLFSKLILSTVVFVPEPVTLLNSLPRHFNIWFCSFPYSVSLFERLHFILALHMFALLKGFPGGSDGKESACNVGDLGSIPGLGRSPGEGNGNPL